MQPPPNFKEAIISLKGYPNLEHVPNVLFRRINQIIALEKELTFEDACEGIAIMVGASRDAVKEKLEAHPSTYKRLQESEA